MCIIYLFRVWGSVKVAGSWCDAWNVIYTGGARQNVIIGVINAWKDGR
jgi:hypothetical protein